MIGSSNDNKHTKHRTDSTTYNKNDTMSNKINVYIHAHISTNIFTSY